MAKDKEKIEARKKQLIDLTTDFCNQYITDEYAELSKKLIEKMARKKEVPFLRGKIENWAAGVIHALGTINFLFDKSTEPYASLDVILEYFGTKQSTTSQKSKHIREMFKLGHFHPDFTIQSIEQDNPFNNMQIIDGFIVPKR
ncbi:hypothetical protein N782_00630 [Pontibacillus yanchengensis Y32]|uniref:DUF6398 domain-containing protein n=1 Tax=Pontibacillus yanchengensis Y32 TaxID=1385514 RepID=A0A0A2TKI7_9BACI|nr:hypothetical protein N782_00630 [Pontibacillus yanchengensis Y32]